MKNQVESGIDNGVSRRMFLRTLGAAGAAAATLPAMAFAAAPLQNRRDGTERVAPSPDTVIISSNENPLGPAPVALTAICDTASQGGRYHFEIGQATVNTFSEQFSLKKGYVQLFPGSGGPLDMALMSNIGPDRPLVVADPSYEQGPRAAMAMKAPLFPVKLTPTYAHDVKAMLAAHPSPGAYYIVNPNNPTGTMTPKADIVWLLANKPKGSVVIVDEAYHHFSDDDSCIDLVAADQDVIVMRTFSKIYGMAGIRAGVAVARPDLLARFKNVTVAYNSLGSISIVSAAAARASLMDKDLVPLRKKINADTRAETLEFMTKKGYHVLPGSQANFFMVDVKRPGGEFQKAMMAQKVAIGRTWAAMPNYVRVTVGTPDEMQKFQTAFVKVYETAPANAAGASLHLPDYHMPSELDRHVYA